MLHELAAVVQTLADEVDQEQQQTGEVDQEEVELVDEGGPLEDYLARFAEFHLVEFMQGFVAYQRHLLLVQDGRDVMQGVFSKFNFEDIVILDDSKLG